MLSETSCPSRPSPDLLWYHARRAWDAGGCHVELCSEEPVKAPRAVAALSLGLVSFGFLGCRQRAERLRFVEPRLTGDAYGPCQTDRGTSGLIPAAVCGESAGPLITDGVVVPGNAPPVRRGPAPKPPDSGGEISELGEFLSQSDVQRLSRAIRGLERRSVDVPADAQNWSDLSAAYLVRAQRAEEPQDLLRAYGAADQAVHLDGALPAARFNRALSLERLVLLPEALAAWQEYRQLDATSGWATEAQKHIEALSRPPASAQWDQQQERLERAALAGRPNEVEAIVRSYRQAAREYAEQKLFGLWADAAAAGQSEAAADRLRVLRGIGDALVKVNGEHLVRDSVAVIDSLSGGDAGRWQDLIEAHRAWRDGFAAYRVRNCPLAVAKLSAARNTLAGLGSPLALRAEFCLVGCDYLIHRFARGLAGAERLAQKVKNIKYGGLRGNLFHAKGTLEDALGRTRDAIADYGRMQTEFRNLGEGENIATASGLLGRPLRLLGRKQQAWRFIYQSLQVAPDLRNETARANIFMTAGDAALREGADAAALAFQQARVRCALRADPLAAVEALTWLARLQEHAGDRVSARATLQEAKARIGRLEESQARRRSADLAMIEGEMQVEEDPRRAVDLLTTALDVYQEDQNFLFSLQTLLARGRAQRRLGDGRAAEGDLDAALGLYDRLGEKLSQEDLRLAFLEETAGVFDEMVSLQAEHDPDLAFAYADRARTRVLPGSVSELWVQRDADPGRLLAAEPQPLPLDEIRRRLPAGTTLVQFFVLPDRVLIWRLRRDEKGPGFFVRSIPRGELETAAEKLQDFESTQQWEKARTQLFDLLLRPWLASVPAGERIVLIPDKMLHRVPFAALQDRATGKLLIESHPLAVAPSATLYVRALERQALQRPAGRSAGLVVGDPAVDRTLFFDLPDLPKSAAEARQVAALTGSLLLAREDARKPDFLAAAKQADWIHFSGHALIDAHDPLLSKLVLAPAGEGDPGVLTAQEIYSLRLARTRLVVLAACDTGNEYIPGSEGSTSLARAFLAAGVPAVVASLWSVDDQETAALFAAFHQFLAAGEDPVDALRKAQLQRLHAGGGQAGRSMRAWAAFEVIGASAE